MEIGAIRNMHDWLREMDALQVRVLITGELVMLRHLMKFYTVHVVLCPTCGPRDDSR